MMRFTRAGHVMLDAMRGAGRFATNDELIRAALRQYALFLQIGAVEATTFEKPVSKLHEGEARV